MLNLGICYDRGTGVGRDKDKAIFYFKEAADKGDVDGKMNYVYYLLKTATDQDNIEDYYLAADYLREIIAYNPYKSEPYFYLGFLYENGFGVT